MKKGFTLIELLAVIVILAIIALIATPIVLNIINEVNQSSNIESMKNLERAVELYYANNQIKEDIVFECSEEGCKNGEKILQMKGKAPSQGKILVDKKGNITYEDLVLNGYNCYKEHDKHICSKDKIRKTFTENSIVINTSRTQKLTDYKIYGNSEQNGIPSTDTSVDIESVGEKTNNLFRIIDEAKTVNGVTLSYNKEENVFELNGTSTLPYSFEIVPVGGVYEKFSNEDSYTLSFREVSGECKEPPHIFIKDSYTNSNYFDLRPKQTTTLIKQYNGEGYINRMAISIPNKELNYINYKFQIQLEVGNDATEYEPYGYKIPVKISGKNLIDHKSFKPYNDGTITFLENGLEYTGTYYISIDGSHLKSGSKYYMSWNYESNDDITPVWRIQYTDNTYSSLTSNRSNRTIPSDKTVKNILVYPKVTSDVHTTKFTDIILTEAELKEYEPYFLEITNIYLNEPLRCQKDICDYIDFKNQKLVRYIEKLEDGTIRVLNTPKEEKIELPEILLNKGVNNISVETSVSPSKIELEYYK